MAAACSVKRAARTPSTSNLYLGYYAGSSGSYNLSGGLIFATNEYVGYSGSGAFSQSAGTNSVGTLTLGNSAGSTGAYNLNGGLLALGAGGITAGQGMRRVQLRRRHPGASAGWSSSVAMTLTGSGGNATIDTTGGNITLTGCSAAAVRLPNWRGHGGIVRHGHVHRRDVCHGRRARLSPAPAGSKAAHLWASAATSPRLARSCRRKPPRNRSCPFPNPTHWRLLRSPHALPYFIASAADDARLCRLSQQALTRLDLPRQPVVCHPRPNRPVQLYRFQHFPKNHGFLETTSARLPAAVTPSAGANTHRPARPLRTEVNEAGPEFFRKGLGPLRG